MTEQEWLASDDPQAMLRHLTHEWRQRGGQTLAGKPVLTQRQREAPLASDRKLRLFACACYRAVKPHRGVHEAMVSKWETDAWSFHPLALLGRFFESEVGQHPQFASLLRDVVGNPFRSIKVEPAVFIPHLDAWDFSSAERWLTPTVLSLAQAAYDERPGRECDECDDGVIVHERDTSSDRRCDACNGTGTISDGTLDPVRLMVLADALEEAGCRQQELLDHLRGAPAPDPDPTPWEYRESNAGKTLDQMCAEMDARLRPRPARHVRGCWALDLVLGRS